MPSPPTPLPQERGDGGEDEELWFDFAKQEAEQDLAVTASLKLDVQIIDTIPKLEKLCEILSGKQIGRASCRERVSTLV